MDSAQPIHIIGGGLGGLFTGALLARAGRRVVVLEQLPTAGGGLQQFQRYGRTFGTGMHLVGGLSAGSALRRLCDHLGITERVAVRPCDALAEVTVADGTTYRLPADAAERLDYLRQQFPHEAEGLERYEAELRQLSDEVDLFHLRRRPEGVSPFEHSEQLLMPADEFVGRCVHDPQLRQLLQFAELLYEGRPGHTPAYIHAVVSTLYRRDAEMPVLGAPTLADALTDVIRTHGGEVRTRTAVTHIDCEQRHLTALHTSTGEVLSVDTVVAAIAPNRLLEMLPAGAFPALFTRRLAQLPMGVSAFKVCYDLEPNRVPFVAHPVFDYSATPWMWLTPPEANQGPWAQTLEAICPMPFSAVSAWADSTTGHRPADYEQWKQQHIDEVTARLERRLPDFRAAVRHAFAATPLTWRDWLGTPEGAMFGTLKDCLDPARTHLSVYTKIDNLYLTGQCVHLHGICGTPLTAVLTAEAILGAGSILGRV